MKTTNLYILCIKYLLCPEDITFLISLNVQIFTDTTKKKKQNTTCV